MTLKLNKIGYDLQFSIWFQEMNQLEGGEV